MRYREFKLTEADLHNPAWDKRSIRSVIDLNILHNDEYFANKMRPNDGLLILGLVGDPKLKKLQSDMRWVADQMSSADPNNLDSRVQNVGPAHNPDDDVQGSFTPWSGKLRSVVRDLKSEWEKYADNLTLQHEALHRAFSIIAATPKLMSLMPAELKNNWSQGIGNQQFDRYDPTKTDGMQFSPEHSMIYSVTDPDGATSHGARHFNRGLYENYSWVKRFFDRLAPEFNDRFADLEDDYDRNDLDDQMLLYWQILYKQCDDAIRGALSVRGLLYSPRPPQRPDPNAPTRPRGRPQGPGSQDTFTALQSIVQMMMEVDLDPNNYEFIVDELTPLVQQHYQALGYSPTDPTVIRYINVLATYLTNLSDPQMGNSYRRKLENLLDMIENQPANNQDYWQQ